MPVDLGWQRDPGVQLMIDYLDKDLPLKYKIDEDEWDAMPSLEKWSLCSEADRKAIIEQATDCQDDFTYAAKNYFWITTKGKKDKLFSLWEAQHLILQCYYDLKEKGRAQKIIIVKGRQLGALDPDTKVLTTDIRWVRIGDLKPGDQLFSMDESTGRPCTASVVKSWVVFKEAFRISFDDGTTLLATDDHPFRSGGHWITTARLRPGMRVNRADAPGIGGSSGVVSVIAVGIRSMVDVETTTGNFVAEGLVTHNCSTLIEAMLAWRAMFFPNTRAIVVSVDQAHSSYLFSLMAHIYDRMPWWLKPMTARREEKFGLWFDNPDETQRLRHPGLDSKLFVQWSNQYSGVGQGLPIDAAHVSEYTDFFEEDLEAIVNEDLGNSMADLPEVFGFMESTGRGAGSAAHRMWRAFERRMDQGKWPRWYPLFLPSFFETTRVLAPPQGWKLPHAEFALQERVKKEWVKCGNCGRHRKATLFGESVADTLCPECNAGKLMPLALTDEQLYWHQDKREQDEEQGQKAVRQFKQELAVTAEECWQASGYVLFNDACREWMQATVEECPLKKGKLYRESSEIHGADARNKGRCYIKGCNVDHRHDETPLWVWKEPEPGAEYCIGVDVSEGIGEDYSVIFVNKVGRRGAPDEQVAVWRDNHTKPKELAFYANVLGRWYNEALMCVEYNTYQTTGDDLIYKYNYPNVFRWKHLDSVHPLGQKWHWWTKVNTKAYLHQTAVDYLLSHSWIIRSRNFAEETTVYEKDEAASRSFGATEGCNDDELMAGMISLYCSHETDCDETGRVRVPSQIEQDEPAKWAMTCSKDPEHTWGSANPETEYRCPYEGCGSIRFTAKHLEMPDPSPQLKSNDERPIMDQVRDVFGGETHRYRGTSFDLVNEHTKGSAIQDVPYDML